MRILIILGGGGHTTQMLRLTELIGKKYDYEYVIEKSDKISDKKIKFKGRVFRFKKTRNIGESIFLSILKQIIALIPATKLVIKSKADVIIASGPNFAIPIIFIGKLLGKKIIFIESWSRIYTRSSSGKFAYKLADLFFVQWPEMKKIYPKAVYAGRFM
ncbi:MAG: polysaccharide biosynthesis protein [Candidatus Aenigmarchaeota archaeon]|nr:polysaccharide biosynthesis protein [Candidatus Aenigmarchaeota archaeon]